MVPGTGFVQEQGLHAKDGLGFEVESIDVEDAGTVSIRRAVLIGTAGGGFGKEGFHGTDLVVGLWKNIKEPGQQPIHFHLEVPIALQQAGLGGVVETRVVVELLEEGLEISLKAHLAPHGIHLIQDPGHLLQTHLVNGGGIELGGGHLLDLVGVPGLPIGQGEEPHAVPAGGQVDIPDEVPQAPVGGHDARGDGGAVGRSQALPVSRADGLREGRHR